MNDLVEEKKENVHVRNHNERKNAEARDNERKKRIWEAVENLKKIEKQEKEDDEKRKEFIKMVIDKTSAAQMRNYEEQKESKAKHEKETNNIQTNNVKKGNNKRISGTSLKDLLNSPEFKAMYENTKEDDEER